MPIPLLGKLVKGFVGTGGIADAADIEIDNSALANIDQTNVQAALTPLDTLITVVNALTPGTGPQPSQLNRPIAFFTNSIAVTDNTIFEQFDNELALYARASDARIDFTLPSEAVIAGRYPASFVILHQGGGVRDASGTNPNNTITLRAPTGEQLTIPPSTTPVDLARVHKQDLAIATKQGDGDPWVVTINTLSSGALLLPDGVFSLDPSATIRFSPGLANLVLSEEITPDAGDGYRVTAGDPDFAGFGVAANDVLVALIDNPSLANSAGNEDWLIIRNAHNNAVSLTELGFLAQVTEIDTTSDSRLVARSDVSDVQIWLSTGALDHAPFLTPSEDPNNPQSDGVSYTGGFELDTPDFEYVSPVTQPNAFLTVLIAGSLDLTEFLGSISVVMRESDGTLVDRFPLSTTFRAVNLPGSAQTYYVFDRFQNAGEFSSLFYRGTNTIDVVFENTERRFRLGGSANVLDAIPDESLDIAKLDLPTQALIQADHTISAEDQAKLDGLQTGSTGTPWTAGELLVKHGDNLPTNDLSSYDDLGQQNGIPGNFGGTRAVTFLVPANVVVSQLQYVEDTSVKVPVTPIGTFLGRQGFTATLPASPFDLGSPVPRSYQVDGTLNDFDLTGADNTFKIHRGNLDPALISALDMHGPSEVELPENLARLNGDLSFNTTTTTNWRALPSPVRATLTPVAAFLWDESREDIIAEANYFKGTLVVDDVTVTFSEADLGGFQANQVFVYDTPDDPNNNSFPGAQNYILNETVNFFFTDVFSTDVDDSNQVLLGFDYALQLALEGSANRRICRFASSGENLLSLSAQEGLYLSVGNQDGAQQTRTFTENFHVIGNQWHDTSGRATSHTVQVEIPDNLTGPLEVTIPIQLDNGGTDEGTVSPSVTITDLDADQNFGNIVLNYMIGGVTPVARTVTIAYDAVVSIANTDRRVLNVTPLTTFNQAGLTYNLSATRSQSETWNLSNTFSRVSVNAGSGHDDHGLFDPSQYETEGVQHRNRILLYMRPFRFNDPSLNPEMAVVIVVDGELENNGNPIRLGRPRSDFDFDILDLSNNLCAVAHFQYYTASDDFPISGPEMVALYNESHRFLNAFTDAPLATDDFVLDANWEMTAGHGVIITDATTGSRTLIELDNGALTFTVLP
ncbi:hypothetical protein P67b_00090 [Ruegeria phage Tedan]|nr:hypothetical protein P67b_00090 [Ruegeria phage Tedan]